MVKDINKLWIGLEYFCSENDSFWNITDKELIKMNIINKEEDILDYHIERIKKTYPAYFDSYKDIDLIKKYINNIDNLLCIGRNGHHRYNNMDHSMLTSFYAVDIIKNRTKNKENIWNINAEKEYHEEK